jgi:hypothetical protein
MAYLKIPNLYQSQEILMFKRCFALEKCHGTSSHIHYISPITEQSTGRITFFSGGAKHETFVALFNEPFLLQKFQEIQSGHNITIYGEAYGGKMQGMSATYGKDLKFVAFDVKIGDFWLDVTKAEALVKSLGLEFVHYVEVSTDLKELDEQRDADSVQAIRNGMGTGKLREGVVLRPLIELTKNNGSRIICKHKRAEFCETKEGRNIVDPSKLKVISDAELVAQEWITENRLKNVASHNEEGFLAIENLGNIIPAMIEDIKKESDGEIVWSKQLNGILGREIALLVKNYVKKQLVQNNS